MNTLFITVEEIAAVMAAGYTAIYVYTDTSETGAFTTLDGNVTLVSGTESYAYTDADGSSSTWYKTAYFGALLGVGTKSAARKADTSAAYVTVDEVRSHVELNRRTHDVELARLADAAALNINRFTGRPDGYLADQTASARYYAGQGKPYLYIDECVAITAIAVKSSPSDTTFTAWDSPTTSYVAGGDWIAFSGSPEQPNFNPAAEGRPYDAIMCDPVTGDYTVFTSGKYATRGGFRPITSIPWGVPTVRVTARWGYSDTVPPDIKVASLMQVARWYKRIQGAMATSVGSAELGQTEYSKLDPDVENFLRNGRYIRKFL